MLKTIIFAGICLALGCVASAQASDDGICQGYGARPGTVDYRECRLLLNQLRSADNFETYAARVRLEVLRQRIIAKLRREEESREDLSAFGPPVEVAPRRPAMECVTFGDGEGGGITDCN